MKKALLFLIVNCTFSIVNCLYAQSPGSLDHSFAWSNAANKAVIAIALQSDEKILIGGEFTEYNGISKKHIARLTRDGSLDNSFHPVMNEGSVIHTILLQPSDEKILIGGDLLGGIARLNTDGSLDPSFNPGTGANGRIHIISLQLDGKILIGGDFTTYNGVSRNRIARLMPDGSIDNSFNPGEGASDDVRSIALQLNGRILIGGDFTAYNGVGRNRIARLMSDGSIDNSFNPGLGANSYIASIILHPSDGTIIIGGVFSKYNGVNKNCIVRLKENGSIDESFNVDMITGGGILSIVLQPDGKILVGGSLPISGMLGIARLNINGSKDISFNPRGGVSNTGGSLYAPSIKSVALMSNGQILIGGTFVKYNGASRNYIARINENGDLDYNFAPVWGAIGGEMIDDRQAVIYSVALQPDGKIIIAGSFSVYGNMNRKCIARLHPDGSLDESFDPGIGALTRTGGSLYSSINAVYIQPDGKIIIGGEFREYNGTGRNRIARLNPDGSIDESFDPGTGISSAVWAIAMQPDGKILLGGRFGVVRRNADGSNDSSFSPGSGSGEQYTSVRSLALQPDGKILIGGRFMKYKDTDRNRIARLRESGYLDNSFNPGMGATGETSSNEGYSDIGNPIQSIVIQSDEKILIGGGFTKYNNMDRNRIARLNSDGSIDESFNPGTGAEGGGNPSIQSVAIQSDGKILIAGTFTTYNGVYINRIARLNQDGSLDESFNPARSANNRIEAIILQSDDKILIGGEFSEYQGTPRSRIARLHGKATITEIPKAFTLPGFSIYPNPNPGIFTIELPAEISTANATYIITDLTGRTIQTGALGGSQTSVQLNVPAGIYLAVLDVKGARVVKRLLVQAGE